ncbi:unnamed protein product [Coffea canephora]|uniref:Uncharacterized protein n=1 Tax=Coffea canephora TaxID=49390 RepID=A0A068VF16_COFCA|nr:unnamed protein product [Coffea canephora]
MEWFVPYKAKVLLVHVVDSSADIFNGIIVLFYLILFTKFTGQILRIFVLPKKNLPKMVVWNSCIKVCMARQEVKNFFFFFFKKTGPSVQHGVTAQF